MRSTPTARGPHATLDLLNACSRGERGVQRRRSSQSPLPLLVRPTVLGTVEKEQRSTDLSCDIVSRCSFSSGAVGPLVRRHCTGGSRNRHPLLHRPRADEAGRERCRPRAAAKTRRRVGGMSVNVHDAQEDLISAILLIGMGEILRDTAGEGPVGGCVAGNSPKRRYDDGWPVTEVGARVLLRFPAGP